MSVTRMIIAATALAAPALTPISEPATTPACVSYGGESRYRYPGYDHVVYIFNGCASVAICDVSSNIDPRPIRVRLTPGEHDAILLRRASPSRTFVPHVDCEIDMSR